MGLSNTNSDRATYLNIIDGKITRKVNQETPNAVARTNKKGDTVYELQYDKLEATIEKMQIEKDDFGKKLVVTLSEAADRYLLTIPVESKFFDHFCAKIGNVNIEQPVTIAPYSFIPKGEAQKKSGLNFYQKGLPESHYAKKKDGTPDIGKVGYYFTDEEPKGKPQPASAKLDEDEWKIFKMQERKFYCEFIAKVFGNEPTERPTEPALSKQKPVVKEQESSDLPF